MSYSPVASTSLHAQVSLASSINASKTSGSAALLAETGLASASIQDGAWAAKVESLLAPPIVSVALSSVAQQLLSDGPTSIAVGTRTVASTGALLSKMV